MDFIGIESNYNQERIEFRLLDSSYNPFFKKQARLSKKKEVLELIAELKAKGVDLSDYIPREYQ